ncbi:MAG TPA: ribose-phosphate pyrophosphokinase [Candidatus Saccharimonadales bacterium]|nr:ribose-phosphate pyrophosphokinase [Candidatus Saccharimonadales bacterium]
MDRDIKIFSGSANPTLAKAICRYLDLPLGQINLTSFRDGESYCQILENVRGGDVFIIQPTCPPVNTNLMELLVMLDAFKRSSSSRITAVIPYYGYARQERKDKPRVPISAKLVADLLNAAGADRILTIDLHAPAIQGFFDIPVDHLFAAPVFISFIEKLRLQNLTIVSPDAGGVERARAYAKRLDASLAIVDKRRGEGNVPQVMHLIGDVKGRTALIVDDIVDSATTVMECAKAVAREGASEVFGCFTHPVLSEGSVQKLMASKLTRTWVTDSIPLDEERRSRGRLEVLSVASLLGEAILRIHNNSSVSSLFI